MLLNMSPAFPMNNSIDYLSRYIVFFRHFFKKFGVFFSYFYGVFCFKMKNTSSVSILFHHILSIVFMCTKKQMIRVNALSVITFMTNKITAWNFSAIQLKRNSVSSKGFSTVATRSHLPITPFPKGPKPNPTRIGFVNFVQKTLFDCPSFWSSFHGKAKTSSPGIVKWQL